MAAEVEVLLLLMVVVSEVDSILEISLKELPAREVRLKGALIRRAARCLISLELLMVLWPRGLVELLFVALVMVEVCETVPGEVVEPTVRCVSSFMASLDCLVLVGDLLLVMVGSWVGKGGSEITLKGLFLPVVMGPGVVVLEAASCCRLCVRVVLDESVLLMAPWGLMELGVS